MTLVVARSDLIIAQTKYFWEEFSRKNELQHKKNIAIPMGFDSSKAVCKYSKVQLRQMLGLPVESKIIIYFGSVDAERDPQFILDIYKKILKKQGLYGLIIGGGQAQKQRLCEMVEKMKIQSSMIIMESVERDLLFKYLRASDLSLSPIPPVPTYIISSPTKVIESMGFGVPVIANIEILEQKEILKESNGGILVDYNVDSFASAIHSIIGDKNKLGTISKNAQQYIYKHRSYTMLAKKLKQQIEGIVKDWK